ncbi:MAG: hypothetical protein JO168_10975 [Solirubrobacterales bacterium]|nr:hypothetical protein [Solirubrobacterales bacterium]
MIVGINTGAWGISAARDVRTAFRFIRWDASLSESLRDYTSRGLKADVVMSNPYTTRGVTALADESWGARAVGWYQTNCHGSTSACPVIEVLNEPYASAFWGNNANSQANAVAYGKLVESTYDSFHARYGPKSPKILASTVGAGCPNGSGPSCTTKWWSWLIAGVPDIRKYYDGVVIHPYGGGCDTSAWLSASGNRNAVTSAYVVTGKPVWVTEIGWPTATRVESCNVDSRQWAERQQARNIYNFVTWARSTGYVAAVLYFGYRDYGPDSWYGLERWGERDATLNGSKKLGWYALADAAEGRPCTVC